MKRINTNTQINHSSKIKINQKLNLTLAAMTIIIKRMYHLTFFLLEISNKMIFQMIMI